MSTANRITISLLSIIARIERDEYFMKYMSGQKQVIMTGELFGAKWKIKIDSYIPDVAIVDLKVMCPPPIVSLYPCCQIHNRNRPRQHSRMPAAIAQFTSVRFQFSAF